MYTSQWIISRNIQSSTSLFLPFFIPSPKTDDSSTPYEHSSTATPHAFSTTLLTPFDDTSESLVEPPSNEQPSHKINLEPQNIPVLTTRPLSLPNPSRILTQHELGSKIPVRITSCRPISNFPINYKSHNPHNCIKIKTTCTTSNTFLPSLFISNARSLVNKIDELSSTVSNYSADIVVITETWLSNNVDNSVIGSNGFSTFRHDRSDGRRGGGVCVYVNNRFPVFHLEDISVPDIESIWLLLKPSRLPRGFNSIILGAIYHPPRNDDRSLLAHIMESLDRVLASNPGAAVILTGDFNQFKHRQLCSSFSLKQIVKRPTRGSNVLDKIFTNVSNFKMFPMLFHQLGFLITTLFYSRHLTIVRTHVLSVL